MFVVVVMCPVFLWLYGYKDRSNPSQICEELINGIATDHKKNFTVKTFPDGNHGLLICEFGGSAEYRSLGRLVPDLYGTIENWLVSVKQMPVRE